MSSFMRALSPILVMLLIFSVFFIWGYNVGSHEAQTYKEMAVQTCEYSVKLTELSNNQLDMIELLDKTAHYDRLNYLNCSRII